MNPIAGAGCQVPASEPFGKEELLDRSSVAAAKVREMRKPHPGDDGPSVVFLVSGGGSLVPPGLSGTCLAQGGGAYFRVRKMDRREVHFFSPQYGPSLKKNN